MEVEAADAEAAEAEGRACFPVPLVDVQVLGDSAHAGLLRRAHTVIDRASYLNWSLTRTMTAPGSRRSTGVARRAAAARASAAATRGR